MRPLQGAQVQSLVIELRSHMLYSTAKKKKGSQSGAVVKQQQTQTHCDVFFK